MMENPLSLVILGSVISIGSYLIYRIDVWATKSGLKEVSK